MEVLNNTQIEILKQVDALVKSKTSHENHKNVWKLIEDNTDCQQL